MEGINIDQLSLQCCPFTGYMYIPDCIYRRSPVSDNHLYDSEEALWIPVHPDEETLIAKTTKEIAQRLPQDVQVVCPATLGNHVDH